jgi:hypothetical protein
MGYLHGYRTPGGQRRFPVQELDEFVSSLDERTTGPGRFVRESGQEAGTAADGAAPDVPR